jgi:hypothetical protein
MGTTGTAGIRVAGRVAAANDDLEPATAGGTWAVHARGSLAKACDSI